MYSLLPYLYSQHWRQPTFVGFVHQGQRVQGCLCATKMKMVGRRRESNICSNTRDKKTKLWMGIEETSLQFSHPYCSIWPNCGARRKSMLLAKENQFSENLHTSTTSRHHTCHTCLICPHSSFLLSLGKIFKYKAINSFIQTGHQEKTKCSITPVYSSLISTKEAKLQL